MSPECVAVGLANWPASAARQLRNPKVMQFNMC